MTRLQYYKLKKTISTGSRGSECWETRMKTIEYCFRRSFLDKVGRVASLALGKAQLIDHTT